MYHLTHVMAAALFERNSRIHKWYIVKEGNNEKKTNNNKTDKEAAEIVREKGKKRKIDLFPMIDEKGVITVTKEKKLKMQYFVYEKMRRIRPTS